MKIPKHKQGKVYFLIEMPDGRTLKRRITHKQLFEASDLDNILWTEKSNNKDLPFVLKSDNPLMTEKRAKALNKFLHNLSFIETAAYDNIQFGYETTRHGFENGFEDYKLVISKFRNYIYGKPKWTKKEEK